MFDTDSMKEAVINAINDLVIYKDNCDQYETKQNFTPCGLNLFFPINLDAKNSFAVDKADYVGNNTKLTTWQLICNRYTEGWN